MAIKYIIMAPGRVGSTSLDLAFNALRPDSCISEPFNCALSWDTFQLPITHVTLAGIFSRYDGIKHIWFNRPDEIDIFGERDERFILMFRKNLLQQAISVQMSIQTGKWWINERENMLSFQFQPLRVE